MCWSFEASVATACVGLGGSVYLAVKKAPLALSVTLGFYAAMELLQAFNYRVIDQCGNPYNEVFTVVSYFHILLQPFVMSFYSLHFLPDFLRKKVQVPVYILCFIAFFVFTLKLYPFSWAGVCVPGYEPLCGQPLCSYSGKIHIAWKLPLNQILSNPIDFITTKGPHGIYFLIHFFYFVLPLIYGSWRIAFASYALGPFLVRFISYDPNESPAIWCTLGIGMLIVFSIPSLRKHFYVKSWYGWKPRV